MPVWYSKIKYPWNAFWEIGWDCLVNLNMIHWLTDGLAPLVVGHQLGWNWWTCSLVHTLVKCTVYLYLWAAAHILYTLQGQEVQSPLLYYPYYCLIRAIFLFIVLLLFICFIHYWNYICVCLCVSTFTPLKRRKVIVMPPLPSFPFEGTLKRMCWWTSYSDSWHDWLS